MYIVIELQTNGTQIGTLINKYSDIAQAYQQYYTILAAAAVSNVGIHTAMIITPTGDVIASQHFSHIITPIEE